jgi:hypothetical protein
MTNTVVPNTPRFASLSRAVVTTVIVTAIFLYILYGTVKQPPFIGFPFTVDDYIWQSCDPPVLTPSRPVAMWAVYLVSRIPGKSSFYIAQHVFTLVYPLLVLWFLSIFCNRSITPIRAMAFAVIAFCSTGPLLSCKFTLTSNHASQLFGIGAMLLLHHAQLKRRWDLLAGGILLFALSTFGKEDFILAVLLLGCYHLITARFRAPIAIVQFGLLLAVCTSLWAYTKWIEVSPFISGGNENYPYHISLAPASVYHIALHYLGCSLPTLLLQIGAGTALVGGLFLARRLEFAFGVAIVLALVAPYSILPNHVCDFYMINWSPWIAGLIVIVPPTLALDGWQWEFILRRLVAGLVAAAVVFGLVKVLQQTQAERTFWAKWIQAQQTRNQHIVSELCKNQKRFGGEPVVGVVGMKDLSPWLNLSGTYLARLGFTQRWVVFVKPGEPLYDTYMEPSHELPPGRAVCFQPLSALSDYPAMPCVCYDDATNLTGVCRAGDLEVVNDRAERIEKGHDLP